MSIALPNDLPAAETLRAEGVPLLGEDDGTIAHVCPVRVALLNLMPNKEETETQLARLLGATVVPVELTLLTTSSYRSKNVSAAHLDAFYRTTDDVQDQQFEGLIVTGAPVELMPFQDVIYWDELCAVFDWSRTHTHSQFLICWGAQAGLYHFHGVDKHVLPIKRFGIFEHLPAAGERPPLLAGLGNRISIPVSRHTEVRAADLPRDSELDVLLASETAGLCLLRDAHTVYMFNHLEYDTNTLGDEYRRDLGNRDDVPLPHGYFPDDDPSRPPPNTWRAGAHALFGNWVRGLDRVEDRR